MSDFERIWLQPDCCADHEGCGRLWCQDDVFTGECDDGKKPTEYIRADIATAEIEQLQRRYGCVRNDMKAASRTIDEQQAEIEQLRNKLMEGENLAQEFSYFGMRNEIEKKHPALKGRIGSFIESSFPLLTTKDANIPYDPIEEILKDTPFKLRAPEQDTTMTGATDDCDSGVYGIPKTCVQRGINGECGGELNVTCIDCGTSYGPAHE